jgi:hypothetical protein
MASGAYRLVLFAIGIYPVTIPLAHNLAVFSLARFAKDMVNQTWPSPPLDPRAGNAEAWSA